MYEKLQFTKNLFCICCDDHYFGLTKKYSFMKEVNVYDRNLILCKISIRIYIWYEYILVRWRAQVRGWIRSSWGIPQLDPMKVRSTMHCGACEQTIQMSELYRWHHRYQKSINLRLTLPSHKRNYNGYHYRRTQRSLIERVIAIASECQVSKVPYITVKMKHGMLLMSVNTAINFI